MSETARDVRIDAPGCPFHGRSLPTDGTPLVPSARFAEWRDEAPATPLAYPDGHDGLVATRYDMARAVLADERFSLSGGRFPIDLDTTDELDDDAQESLRVASLLELDGDQHLRMRRAVLPHFALRAVRARRDEVARIVAEQLVDFLGSEQPADVFAGYATPISARVHRLVLGLSGAFADEYDALYLGEGTRQEKFEFIRRFVAHKRTSLGDDVASRLIEGGYTRLEVEGLLFVLMGSGRDSVAYLISTAVVALLTHPEQLALLRAEPERIDAAIEEFQRVGAMFVTLFPRTATEDLELEGVAIAKGRTVAVSPVAANHDERRYERPDEFDITREAHGHLGFGFGPHGCVGQQLARIEIAEAILQLIAATPGLRLIDAEQLSPGAFASPVPTYEAGAVVVAWG